MQKDDLYETGRKQPSNNCIIYKLGPVAKFRSLTGLGTPLDWGLNYMGLLYSRHKNTIRQKGSA